MRATLITLAALLLSGCASPVTDSGRAELAQDDLLVSDFEITASEADLKVRVEATGDGVDVVVMRSADFDAWNDGQDVDNLCGLAGTRLFEQDCLLQEGLYTMVVYNPFPTPSTVVWSWTV